MLKKSILPCILLALSVFPSQGARPKKNADEVGLRYLETNFHLYDSLQKNIFNYAETGYKEVRSAAQWVGFLREQGFSVEEGVAGIPTAFVATFGSGAPVIGMMAEYDAIAGMSQDTVPYRKVLVEGAPGHACGHNLPAAITCWERALSRAPWRYPAGWPPGTKGPSNSLAARPRKAGAARPI